jgi:DNA-binding XRE family transcriptional regulator
MGENIETNMAISLKLARIRAGLTQQQVSTVLGIRENTLSQIETGRYVPGEELVKQINDVYARVVCNLGVDS